MNRRYPAKMFWFFVLTNFLFHYFYLSIPGLLLCMIGIWFRPCLRIGLAVLALDLVLSIWEQLRIRKAAVTPSDNPEFNELMDAFCGPGGMEEFRRVLDEKLSNTPPMEIPTEDADAPEGND